MTQPHAGASSRFVLTVRLGASEWNVDVYPPATIGRGDEADVVVNNTRISRVHARFDVHEGVLYVTDLGSTNGTRVNGVAITASTPQAVRPGDEVGVGDAIVRITPPAQNAPHASSSERTYLQGADDLEAATIGAIRTFKLIVRTPQGSHSYIINRPQMTIGRAEDNDIVISDSMVSSNHAILRTSAAGHEIVDNGSRNGLTVAGATVPSHVLRDGDVVRIGGTVSIHYQADVAVQQVSTDTSLELGERQAVTIGRGRDCDIVVPHPTVSRMHARVSKGQSATGYVLEDLGSSNGTYLNGTRLSPGAVLALGDGDHIQVGPARFVVSPTALVSTGSLHEIQLDAVHLHQQVTPTVNLLQDLSLSIRPREFVALVGVSGAGKSTLMAALSGFKPATRGAVLLNGVDLYDNFDSFRTTLGYVPQDDILHRELPVQRAFDYAARLRLPADTTREERAKRVEEVIHTLGLEERRDVPIGQLSGGQRKRVSIGAELITEPGLFFLDEATSGLDPGTESQLMRLLRELADDGHTIVLITHATKNVAMCDQVIFLARGGHLAYYGPPDEALPYFGVPDFDGIYEKLEAESTPEAWGARFLQSKQYEAYVQRRLGPSLDTAAAGGRREPATANTKPIQRANPFTQFWILTRRYLDIIARDRVNVLLLILIAPVLGAIDLIAWPRDVFDFEDGDATRAVIMLFLSALIPFMIGSLTSVREIVKEGPIYNRERTVVLHIIPYLASKLAIGFMFALYWAGALLAIKLLAVDFPDLTTMEIAQFYLMIFAAAASGVMIGLLVSALVSKEEQAMLYAIGLVVVQIVFSGGLVSLAELGPVGQGLGAVTSTHWVLEGMVTVTDLQTGNCELGDGSAVPDLSTCVIPGLGEFETDPERAIALEPSLDRFGDLLGTSVNVALAWLGGIAMVLFGLLYVIQKRKDVV